MNAVILSIGSELVRGQVVDTNSAWLSQRLAELGIAVRAHVTLGDDESVIAETIDRVARSAQVVLITGGLGPTEDDLTRQALARVMGTELIEDAASWEQIQAYFARRSYKLTPANRRQALVPRGAFAIENTCGTAPGIRAEVHGSKVFCLPGVPAEMRAMFAHDVAPELGRAAGGRVIVSQTLLTFGKGESAIGETITDLMVPGRNPSVGTQACDAVIGIRVCAQGDDAKQARELLDRDCAEIRARLGDWIFGTESDTLAGAVGRLLKRRGATLCVAESCTGGMLAKLITDVPGSSEYFVDGVVTYANQAKTRLLGVPGELIEHHGAVSAEVAEAMAVGCRQNSGSDYALSTTGVAGPTGGTPEKPVGLVYVALADADGADVRELRFGSHLNRDQIRVRACRSALNLLRRRVLKTLR